MENSFVTIKHTLFLSYEETCHCNPTFFLFLRFFLFSSLSMLQLAGGVSWTNKEEKEVYRRW